MTHQHCRQIAARKAGPNGFTRALLEPFPSLARCGDRPHTLHPVRYEASISESHCQAVIGRICCNKHMFLM